jgi:hypothetical protein
LDTKLLLKLLAPYLAVAVFWCGLSNGWLAILAYHAQVLFWSRSSRPGPWLPVPRRVLPLVLPAALAGPLLYVLLPVLTGGSLPTWLADHRLSGVSLVAMIPYFGLVHPVLEQLHWAPLRARTPWAHPVFAGYHMLVLGTLLPTPWLVACFVLLTAVSALWHELSRRGNGLSPPALSHVLADLGVVAAAWFRT